MTSSEAKTTATKPKRNRNDFDKWLAGRSYQLFKSGIKSPRTLDFYRRCLYFFCSYAGMTTEELVTKYSAYLKQNSEHRPNIEGQIELQQLIENYVLYLRQKVDSKEMEATTCVTRIPAVKLLFDMNATVILNWTRINRLLPRGDMAADDEAYTRDDIRKMLEHCDLRARTIILVLASSGMRLDAVSELNDDDITPLYDSKDNRLLAAHVKVYSRSPEDSYDSFVSPEAYKSYSEYRNLRISCGDTIEKNDPVFIARFNKKTFRRGKPKRLNRGTTEVMMLTIRKKAKVDNISKRYNSKHFTIKTVHGFRKFWNTSVKSVKNRDGQQVVSHENKELIIGHRLTGGLTMERNYDRSEMIQKLLADYVKVVHALTISDEERLKLKLDGLQEEVKSLKTLDIELSQRDREVRQLKEQLRRQRETEDRRYAHVIWMIQQNPRLASVKPEELEKLKPQSHNNEESVSV